MGYSSSLALRSTSDLPSSGNTLADPVPAENEPGHMDGLYREILARFDVRREAVSLGGKEFALLVVRDSNLLLERLTPEAFAVDERLPYWADLWSSSLEMARWCLEDLNLKGLRVLELGCGVGLAGIAASASGAHVTMTDYEEDALLFTRYNVQANMGAITFPPAVCRLDWRVPPGDVRFDVVLGADIVYERARFGDLLHLFDRLLAPGGCVLLTEPGRSAGRDFVALARQAKYLVVETEHERAHGLRNITHRRILMRREHHG
jgi:predicted nicotinamide N-methyase